MLNVADFPTRTALRNALRQKRRRLSPAQQSAASLVLSKLLRQLPDILFAKHIAIYMANDGEINPQRFMHWAKKTGKQIWLPVIDPLQRNHLKFVKISSNWQRNRFGIAEPKMAYAKTTPVWRMDIVCLPLVGFDAKGNRLGMGKGFYDRTLAFLRSETPIKSPRLLGLAHQCQQVDELSAATWDIPLDLIVTDGEVINAKA